MLGIPPMDAIKVSSVFYRRNLGVADYDNDLSRLKPCIDGLVDAGVIPRDTRKHVAYGSCREEHGTKGFDVIVEEAFRCSKCKTLGAEPFLKWFLCLGCYGKMAMAFLIQEDYNDLEEWITNGRVQKETRITNVQAVDS